MSFLADLPSDPRIMPQEEYEAAVKELDYRSSLGMPTDDLLQAKVQRHQTARRQMDKEAGS